MVLDGGVFSTTAITSTFTAVLRISQAVYELKAVGEQTRDLLDTTKYVNYSLSSVRELRRKKSDLLNREEKRWIDQQIEFTQKAVDSVAVLIERARVDMQAKNETGNEDDYQTKHIKIHHRARFVLEDGPKVQTNLSKVNMAMTGLNSAMVTLSSREGHDVRHQPSKSSTHRRSTSSSKAPPPYAEGDFLNRHRTVVQGTQKEQAPKKSGFLSSEDQEALPGFGSPTVPTQSLHSRASMCSITPSINFTAVQSSQYYENAIADDTISPACLPTNSVRDSISSDTYFSPHLTNTSPPLPNTYELDSTEARVPTSYELDATWHPPLHTYKSAPAVPTRAPTIPRKPVEYQRHRASTPSIVSITSIHDEFAQHLTNPWVSPVPSQPHSPHRPPVDAPKGPWTTTSTAQSHSRSPYRVSIDAQKDLPMLPLHLTPMASTTSLNSTLSDLGNASATGPPPVSRGRSWLIDRANQAATGNVIPLPRTQSSNLPYLYHSPGDIRSTPGGH